MKSFCNSFYKKMSFHPELCRLLGDKISSDCIDERCVRKARRKPFGWTEMNSIDLSSLGNRTFTAIFCKRINRAIYFRDLRIVSARELLDRLIDYVEESDYLRKKVKGVEQVKLECDIVGERVLRVS